MRSSILGILIVLAACGGPSEVIDVKYRGRVDLAPFACTTVTRSSSIERVCFNQRAGELILRLRGTYYVWCGVPPTLVERLKSADSMGQFFNAEVKGRFGCR